ncbi:hypothetical protein GKZ90_0008200 [Flavobacterium sp. MC2016-06]|uniref:hypothetical protein n=1 Tax=Flavobacterium sp. MC2016-06 TaxID=2676308 RepID=UPI0012BAE76B|nr:hypothetical protein [Flavobacterium sp. MC2016-06]MBU3857988.1 hypothetical protein [Flavobacterium sp. MC2016-06]
MDRLKHLIVLFVLIHTQFISAQPNITLDETVFVHSNATTFVSGETLLYKIYCLKSSDKTLSTISKVAYIELVDENKKTVFKNKIILENGNGQGDYFVPTTLKTGNYKLIGYTTWMLNKPVSELFQTDITIINPYKINEKNVTGTPSNTTNSNSVINNNETVSSQNVITNENIKLKLNKKTFTNRELVDLKIETANPIFENGRYSLSVRKLDNLPTKKQISATEFAVNTSTKALDLQNSDSKIILPELRGEIISGKITAKNNTDKIDDLAIGFSLPGKNFVFKVVKTNSNGNFIFNIDKTYYSPNITVQILGDNADNYNLTLDAYPEIDYSKLSFEPNPNLSYTIKESLLNRSISSQIENAYYHKKVDNITKAAPLDPFYSPIAKEYILDDYARFKTLKETMTEIVVEIYHKQKEDKTYLHVNDPSVFPQLAEPALVLVDGLYLENQNELMTYSMKNVYKIEVIVGRYYVGPKAFNGLISFTTFDKDFKSTQSGSGILKTPILRPLPKKIYNKIDYSNLADNEKIPDFRNQLFWNPEVKLNENSKNSFYTSDISGLFKIRLEGFAQDGTPVSAEETIEVKDSTAN